MALRPSSPPALDVRGRAGKEAKREGISLVFLAPRYTGMIFWKGVVKRFSLKTNHFRNFAFISTTPYYL